MGKKILIISKDRLELSSEEVMDWIWLAGHQVVRLNGDKFEDIENKVKVVQQGGNIDFYLDNVNLEDFDVVWLRRWSDALAGNI
jgi:predicted phosphodiesterase